MRVFGESPSFYYELKDYQLDLAEIHDRLISFGLVDGLSFPNFQARTEKLRNNQGRLKFLEFAKWNTRPVCSFIR